MKTIAYGTSIKGVHHYVSGCECQDFCSFSERDLEDDEIKVIAISDGHGAAPHYRSSVGAKFAVEIAREMLYSFIHKNKHVLDEINDIEEILGEQEKNERLNELKSNIQEDINSLKSNIVAKWKASIKDDIIKNPICFIDAQIDTLSSIEKKSEKDFVRGFITPSENSKELILKNYGLFKKDIKLLEENPERAYGATLLAAGQYKKYLILLKLGDGDVTALLDNGSIEYPFSDDEKENTNATDSLCLDNAETAMEAKIFKGNVGLLMLSTDGLSKSFESKSVLGEFSKDMYSLMQESPRDVSKIKMVLMYQSKVCGAEGDDISVAFIANGFADETYEKMIDSIKSDDVTLEVADLEKWYTPAFEKYKISDKFYEVKAASTPLEKVKLTALGLEAFKKVYLQDDFSHLENEISENSSDRAKLFGLQDEYERLKFKQIELYKDKIKELFLENPIKLISYKKTEIHLDCNSDTNVKVGIKKYAIILEISKNELTIAPITKDLYDSILGDIGSHITFVGSATINKKRRLGIKKFELKRYNMQKGE